MNKITDILMWTLVALATISIIVIMYPFYIIRNLGYHLRAPSVFLYSSFFFFLDRITKAMVISVKDSLPYTVIPGFFEIAYVQNPGVAFGWFPDWKLPPILMAIIMVIIIAYYSFQLPPHEKLTRWSLALLVGGALGNLYDRLIYGYVVDFFLFHLGKFDFPVFNIADVAIDLGVFLLFVDIFVMSEEEEINQANSTPSPA